MNSIQWKINCSSSAERIHNALSTSEGRRSFWAERAEQVGENIHFEFPNGLTYSSRIIKTIPNQLFCLKYFGAKVTFEIHPNDDETCTLSLHADGVPEEYFIGMHAGWLSVLLNLKAFVDHGVDLRNHNPERTWDQKFVDN